MARIPQETIDRIHDTADILDVVSLVNLVLVGDYDEAGDINGDGMVNILDIVFLVNLVLGS